MNLLLDADYSSIEARIVCWLAGQEDALDEYRQGIDRYRRMASVIYGVPESEVNKHPQRFVGKQATLVCGYGMGPPKFRLTCKKMGGYDLPEGIEDKAVRAFRKVHAKVVKLWRDLEDAALKAVAKKGEVFRVGKHLSFQCITTGGITFLFMRLPSGRKLAYPHPKIVPGKFEGTTAVSYYTNIKGTKWGHISTWGGTWCEQACQAVAADIMANGASNAEREGYQIATLIHDQALAFHQSGQTVERFVELLTDLPSWAAGLPIAAEGSLVPFYKKD